MRLPSIKNKSIVKVMSFALGVVIASTTTSVFGKEIILHDAIHDYEDNAPGSFRDESSSYRLNAYKTSFILEEAQLDYVDEDVAAFNGENKKLEKAEFAVLDEAYDVPWVLQPLD